MPELRGSAARGGVGVGDAYEGFWIRRVASPLAMSGPRRVRTVAGDNKENIPPAGWLAGRPRTRKSPLPQYYPRTPLRDITAIVNALERRRSRVRATRVSPMNQDNESSPQLPLPSSPLPQESSVSNQTPATDATSISTTSASTITTASPSPAENSLQTIQTIQTSSSSPQANNPSQVSSNPTNVPPGDLKPNETQKKLCSSIDEIEKVVMKNSKRTAMLPSKKATQRRTLMSMR